MSAFTALATRVYKDPITTVYLNSIKQDVDFLNRGCAQAWVLFNGTAATITALNSLNVSNITDNAAGDFTVTFTTGFENTNYGVWGAAHDYGPGGVYVCDVFGTSTSRTTGSVRMRIQRPIDESVRDADRISVFVIGTGA